MGPAMTLPCSCPDIEAIHTGRRSEANGKQGLMQQLYFMGRPGDFLFSLTPDETGLGNGRNNYLCCTNSISKGLPDPDPDAAMSMMPVKHMTRRA
jgi:hypothetical protein